MKFHEIDCVGKLWIHRVPTLVAWKDEDVARLVFVEDRNAVYYGGTVEYADWINVSEHFIDMGSGTDNIANPNVLFTGRQYDMKIVNGNIRLYY